MSDETVGRYSLIRKIATGGMAEIWLAAADGPEGFRKRLVIKRILPNLAEDEDFVRMFLDEARIAARLNHPNIAQIFDLGEADGSYYLAMEYVPGKDLRRLYQDSVKAKTILPMPLTLRILVEAAKGLDFAHHAVDEQGQPLDIVHRDVSPQNILVTFQGGIKIVDFGIAKAADQANHTRTGVLKGKYSYMSPEQAGGDVVDLRTDVFALGVVGYELVTGFRLFKRDNEVQTLQAVRDCKVPAPSSVNRDVPRALDAILLKALTRSPQARFQTAGELALAVEDFLLQGKYAASGTHLAEFMKAMYPDPPDDSGLRPTISSPENESGSSQRQVAVHVPIPPALPTGARTRGQAPVPRAGTSRSVGVPPPRSPSRVSRVAAPPRATASWNTAEDEGLQTEELDRKGLAARAAVAGGSEAQTEVGEGLSEARTRINEEARARLEQEFRRGKDVGAEPTPVDGAGPTDSISEPRERFGLQTGFGPQARRFALRFGLAVGALAVVAVTVPLLRAWLKDARAPTVVSSVAPLFAKGTVDAGCLLCGLMPTDQGKITIVTNPESNVYLGDESLGATPVVELPVSSGHLQLHVVNDTVALDTHISADIRPNQLTTVNREFAQGSLMLSVPKGHAYQVFFRDKPLGHVPGPAIQLVEGTHLLTLVDDKTGARESRTVDVKPDRKVPAR